jgi:hypothetical protein
LLAGNTRTASYCQQYNVYVTYFKAGFHKRLYLTNKLYTEITLIGKKRAAEGVAKMKMMKMMMINREIDFNGGDNSIRYE